MLNEFTYCPRLFHIEWVQARFADNVDTVEGRYQHRAVDQERGAAPLPDEGPLFKAKSVMLSSPAFGVVAKIDLLEADGTNVVPVDTKRGSPPDTAEQAWEPERVQVCAQGLLLREAGYSCDHGVLYFAEARRRVTVDFDDALIARTTDLLSELRRVAESDIPPPPLVDSPKCPRCSLVGICLPDETNALAVRTHRPPRRLVPRDPDPRPLYVSEAGSYVKKEKGRVLVTKNKETVASIRLIDVSQLCVFGNVQVSTQLIRELFANEIPICWFSYGGWFCGIAEGLPSKHIELRRRQVAAGSRGSIEIARRMVEGKIRNSRTMLMRNARQRPEATLDSLKRLAEKAAGADTAASLLGFEGTAARLYFSELPAMLREDKRLPGGAFDFEGRNRRPPKDAVNCLLSYLYALLVKDLTATAFSVGFDPYLGFYHRPRFGRPALALDLAEEFRPLIAESVVINLINNGEVKPPDFVVRAGGVALTQSGRRAVLGAYERRLDHEIKHPMFGYQASYRRVLEVQTRLLGAFLLGEVPEYVPFVTR
ncbi:MAG: CRISPR-associated endonuclease Cas1 [Actinobacteria bacterium]|nr:CRISPR-associated endonuclease Cas1 [Actinomycetota bacterium]